MSRRQTSDFRISAAESAPYSRERITIACLGFLAAVPIRIWGGQGIELTISDLLLGAGLVWALFHVRPPRGWSRSVLAGLLATVTWGVWTVLARSFDADTAPLGFYGLLSVFFYFRAFAAIPLAIVLAGRRIPIALVTRAMAVGGSVSMLAIVASLVLEGQGHAQYGYTMAGGELLLGEHLGGEILGLPLYAQYGVNSLSLVYLVYTALCLHVVFTALPGCNPFGRWRSRVSRRGSFADVEISKGRFVNAVAMAGVCAGTWLLMTSSSRQTQVSLAVLLLGYAAYTAHARLARSRNDLGSSLGRSALTTLAAVGVVLIVAYAVTEVGFRSPELDSRSLVDGWSTGRLTIVGSVIPQIANSPVIGSGFYLLVSEDGDRISLNTHNLVLTAAFKMGLVGAALMVSLLLFISRPIFTRMRFPKEQPVNLLDFSWLCMLAVVGLVAEPISVAPASAPLLLAVSMSNVRAQR